MNVTEGHIRRAQQGDNDAREIVLSAALEFLEDFIGTHVEALADRDDVVQRALMAINEKLETFHVGKSFEDWAAGIAWRWINRYYERGWDDRQATNREIPLVNQFGGLSFEDIEGGIDPRRVIS